MRSSVNPLSSPNLHGTDNQVLKWRTNMFRLMWLIIAELQKDRVCTMMSSKRLARQFSVYQKKKNVYETVRKQFQFSFLNVLNRKYSIYILDKTLFLILGYVNLQYLHTFDLFNRCRCNCFCLQSILGKLLLFF